MGLATLHFPHVIFPTSLELAIDHSLAGGTCYVTLPPCIFSLWPSLTKGLPALPLPLRGGTSRSKSSADARSLQSVHVIRDDPPQLTGQRVQAENQTFSPAQAEGPFPLVRSVWAATPTKSWTALPPGCGTIPSQHSPFALIRSSPCETGNRSVGSGNAPPDVITPPTIFVTSAQDALPPLTELRSVLELRKSQALTPYKVLAWESLLIDSGLHVKYPSIPQGLRTGFIIDMPNIRVTQTPPNKSTISDLQSHFDTIINLELHKRRYIGPFSRQIVESLIGPFQSSPLSMIDKPGKPGCYCLIQNYSYPHNTTPLHPNPSINSFLNSDDFPTTWGTFSIISLLIHQLPPHSQMATRDVAEAYRTIPLHYSQWPGTVVRTASDSYCVDTVASFGFAPSAGVYGKVADAGADLFRYKGIGPLAKWVDDHAFFRIRREFLEGYNQQRQSRYEELSVRGQLVFGSPVPGPPKDRDWTRPGQIRTGKF